MLIKKMRYSYEEYVEYVKELRDEVVDNIKKETEALKDALNRCGLSSKQDVAMSAFIGPFGGLGGEAINEDINVNEFVTAVGIAYHIYRQRKTLKEYEDELMFLLTENGKKEYIEMKGRYAELPDAIPL